MASFSKIKKNLKPQTILVVSCFLIFVGVMVAISIASLAGGSDEEVTLGSSSLVTTPTSEQIDKDKATDGVIFDENTEVGKIYKQNELEEIEEAKESEKTYISEVKIDLKDVQQEVEKNAEENTQPKAMDMLEQMRSERQKNQGNLRAEQATESGANGSTPIENPWKSFIEEERKFAIGYEQSAKSKFDELVAESKNPGGGAQYYGGSSSATKNVEAKNYNSMTTYEKILAGKSTKESSSEPTLVRETEKVAIKDIAPTKNARDMYPSEMISKNISTTAKPKVNVNRGEIFTAVLQIGINTDELSKVRAVIVDKGPMEGAVLIGDPLRVGEKAKVTFTGGSVKGVDFSASAIALDPETYRSALADDVDNHTFERYSKLFIASVAEGYAAALSDTQTITQPDGSSSTTQKSLPNASDQLKVGLGKAGERFTPIFEKAFDRDPTVTVDSNKTIYIMFEDTVILDKKE